VYIRMSSLFCLHFIVRVHSYEFFVLFVFYMHMMFLFPCFNLYLYMPYVNWI